MFLHSKIYSSVSLGRRSASGETGRRGADERTETVQRSLPKLSQVSPSRPPIPQDLFSSPKKLVYLCPWLVIPQKSVAYPCVAFRTYSTPCILKPDELLAYPVVCGFIAHRRKTAKSAVSQLAPATQTKLHWQDLVRSLRHRDSSPSYTRRHDTER